MKFLILFIACFFPPSSSISDRKLRLSFAQSSLSGWKTCTSCKIDKPSTLKDVKLEIQDINDNVDFHLTHFVTELKSHFSSIKDGIDDSYASRFQKASDRVIEKLENLKATIKVNYKELSDSLDHSKLPISQVNSTLKNAKKAVEDFVSNGLDSFFKVFKSLKSEFTINAKKDPKPPDSPKNPEPSSNDNSNHDPETNKPPNTETGTTETKKEDKACADKSDGCEPEKIDLASIPPEAIIRTVDTYLEDVGIEGKKLLESVLINVDN